MADTYDLALVQGETFERTFRWLEDAEPQTFDTFTIRAQVRAKEDPGSTLLIDLAEHITVESSGELDAPANDRLRLRVPANVTSELPLSAFRRDTAAWDIFAIRTADPTEGHLIIEGLALLNPAATDTVDDA